MTTELARPTACNTSPSATTDNGSLSPGSVGTTRIPDRAALRLAVARHRDHADEVGHPLSMIVFANVDSHEREDGPTVDAVLCNHLAALDRQSFVGPYGQNAHMAMLVDVAEPVASEIAQWLVSCLATGGKSVVASAHTYLAASRTDPSHVAKWGGGYPLGEFCYRPIPRWKRWIDLAGSLTAIVTLFPLFLAVALFIKSVSRGPIWFTQDRVGAMGKPFRIIKFRTMHVSNNADKHREYVKQLATSEDSQLKKMDDRCRMIPLARLLRATCIDELPQLFNVLRGEMSLIGPRPDVLPIEAYRHWHLRRFDVLPGMTGLWQVSGKNRTTFSEMIELDIRYARNRSFWLDMKILALTPPAVVAQALSGVSSGLSK